MVQGVKLDASRHGVALFIVFHDVANCLAYTPSHVGQLPVKTDAALGKHMKPAAVHAYVSIERLHDRLMQALPSFQWKGFPSAEEAPAQ